jgi:hypothetical protein
MERGRMPSDVIDVIMIKMGMGERSVKGGEVEFHWLMYNSAKQYAKDYPELFDEFYFSTNGTYPYSEKLESVFAFAMIAHVIKYIDDEMMLSKGTDKYVREKIYPMFSAAEMAVLDEIANEGLKMMPKGNYMLVKEE